MNSSQKHIIHEAEIEFQLDALSKENLNERGFVDWTRDHVLSNIEQIADELISENQQVQIPLLEIDLSIPSEKDLLATNSKLQTVIHDAIKKAIKKSIKQQESNTVSIQKYQANIILIFIQTGQIAVAPNAQNWNSFKESFIKEFKTDVQFRNKTLNAIALKSGFERFYSSYNKTVLNDLIFTFTKFESIETYLNSLLEVLKFNKEVFQTAKEKALYFLVFNAIQKGDLNFEEITKKVLSRLLIVPQVAIRNLIIPKKDWEVLKTILKSATISKSIASQNLLEPSSVKEDLELAELIQKGVFIEQAGLVLLAPFLPQLLIQTNYLSKDRVLQKQDELPILFHYIATGEMEAPEWKLSLPKILAGMPLGQHCKTSFVPTDELKEQIDELLKSVVEHWSALGNSSPEALQETFLHREGKLVQKNGFYYLYIEEKTMDILLYKIPWNYSTIKLEWMSELLFVEWRKT